MACCLRSNNKVFPWDVVRRLLVTFGLRRNCVAGFWIDGVTRRFTSLGFIGRLIGMPLAPILLL